MLLAVIEAEVEGDSEDVHALLSRLDRDEADVVARRLRAGDDIRSLTTHDSAVVVIQIDKAALPTSPAHRVR